MTAGCIDNINYQQQQPHAQFSRNNLFRWFKRNIKHNSNYNDQGIIALGLCCENRVPGS